MNGMEQNQTNSGSSSRGDKRKRPSEEDEDHDDNGSLDGHSIISGFSGSEFSDLASVVTGVSSAYSGGPLNADEVCCVLCRRLEMKEWTWTQQRIKLAAGRSEGVLGDFDKLRLTVKRRMRVPTHKITVQEYESKLDFMTCLEGLKEVHKLNADQRLQIKKIGDEIAFRKKKICGICMNEIATMYEAMKKLESAVSSKSRFCSIISPGKASKGSKLGTFNFRRNPVSSHEGEVDSLPPVEMRPTYSLLQLVTQALLSKLKLGMKTSEIFQFIKNSCAYYQQIQVPFRAQVRKILENAEYFDKIELNEVTGELGPVWKLKESLDLPTVAQTAFDSSVPVSRRDRSSVAGSVIGGCGARSRRGSGQSSRSMMSRVSRRSGMSRQSIAPSVISQARSLISRYSRQSLQGSTGARSVISMPRSRAALSNGNLSGSPGPPRFILQPPFTMKQLAQQVLLSIPSGVASVAEIASAIRNKYEFFRLSNRSDNNFRHGIRETLNRGKKKELFVSTSGIRKGCVVWSLNSNHSRAEWINIANQQRKKKLRRCSAIQPVVTPRPPSPTSPMNDSGYRSPSPGSPPPPTAAEAVPLDELEDVKKSLERVISLAGTTDEDEIVTIQTNATPPVKELFLVRKFLADKLAPVEFTREEVEAATELCDLVSSLLEEIGKEFKQVQRVLKLLQSLKSMITLSMSPEAAPIAPLESFSSELMYATNELYKILKTSFIASDRTFASLKPFCVKISERRIGAEPTSPTAALSSLSDNISFPFEQLSEYFNLLIQIDGLLAEEPGNHQSRIMEVTRYRLRRLIKHAAKPRLGATPSAKQDPRGAGANQSSDTVLLNMIAPATIGAPASQITKVWDEIREFEFDIDVIAVRLDHVDVGVDGFKKVVNFAKNARRGNKKAKR